MNDTRFIAFDNHVPLAAYRPDMAAEIDTLADTLREEVPSLTDDQVRKVMVWHEDHTESHSNAATVEKVIRFLCQFQTPRSVVMGACFNGARKSFMELAPQLGVTRALLSKLALGLEKEMAAHGLSSMRLKKSERARGVFRQRQRKVHLERLVARRIFTRLAPEEQASFLELAAARHRPKEQRPPRGQPGKALETQEQQQLQLPLLGALSNTSHEKSTT